MTYQRFEDLPVWKAAVKAGVEVFELVKDHGLNGLGDVRDQLQRSALSISNNIAEGFERGTTADLVWYLYIARGSAGETRSGLQFCLRLPELTRLKPRIELVIEELEAVSRQLRGWADSLQNSDILGQRHLNDETRQSYRQAKRSEEFLRKIRQMSWKPPEVVDQDEPKG